MPIYEYFCPTCGEFEQMQKITEPALTTCPRGHQGVERKISAAGFILKGSGWYITDYARKGNSGGAGNGKSSSGAKGTSGKESSDAKSGKGASDSTSGSASASSAAAGTT